MTSLIKDEKVTGVHDMQVFFFLSAEVGIPGMRRAGRLSK